MTGYLRTTTCWSDGLFNYFYEHWIEDIDYPTSLDAEDACYSVYWSYWFSSDYDYYDDEYVIDELNDAYSTYWCDYWLEYWYLMHRYYGGSYFAETKERVYVPPSHAFQVATILVPDSTSCGNGKIDMWAGEECDVDAPCCEACRLVAGVPCADNSAAGSR